MQECDSARRGKNITQKMDKWTWYNLCRRELTYIVWMRNYYIISAGRIVFLLTLWQSCVVKRGTDGCLVNKSIKELSCCSNFVLPQPNYLKIYLEGTCHEVAIFLYSAGWCRAPGTVATHTCCCWSTTSSYWWHTTLPLPTRSPNLLFVLGQVCV